MIFDAFKQKNTLKYFKTYYLRNMANEDQNNNNNKDDFQRGLLLDTKPKTKKPSMYNVLLLNDDYTPMEFVVMVLQRFFRLAHDDAVQIMLNVHTKGSGVCGVYPSEIAQTKVREVMNFAKENEHPLQCTMEPE